MQVLLTFDVEIWCDGWDALDANFPESFARYVYGRTRQGSFALPKTLGILDQHNLKGIFFVEPLFAARFGIEHLKTIVALILDSGHEVQLHLHPEWTDEISPPPLANVTAKRQFLSYYSREEQTELVRLALELMAAAGVSRPTAFRAGSFAANADTFAALRANDIKLDFSINSTISDSVADLRDGRDLVSPLVIDGVRSLPMAVFQDGFGSHRHAQVGACSADEMIQAIEGAAAAGWNEFVILSHNFEMQKPGSSAPNSIVVNRFERLCEYLDRNRGRLDTTDISGLLMGAIRKHDSLPQVSKFATLRRHVEQALQRLT
jgi:peptidoglycan/xylan/chitin deacetylase (PgdA/CDA1 family)